MKKLVVGWIVTNVVIVVFSQGVLNIPRRVHKPPWIAFAKKHWMLDKHRPSLVLDWMSREEFSLSATFDDSWFQCIQQNPSRDSAPNVSCCSQYVVAFWWLELGRWWSPICLSYLNLMPAFECCSTPMVPTTRWWIAVFFNLNKIFGKGGVALHTINVFFL